MEALTRTDSAETRTGVFLSTIETEETCHFLLQQAILRDLTHNLEAQTARTDGGEIRLFSFIKSISLIQVFGQIITCNDKMLISVLRVVRGVLDGVCPGRAG